MSYAEKNTVSSKGQLKNNRFIRMHYPENKGPRVLFVGNSITLHGILPEIGWHRECGMAASSIEKDYVHITERAVLKDHPDATFCICQVAEWERNYKNGAETFYLFEDARDFDADIIIMRLSENCPKDGFDDKIFYKAYGELLDYLNKSGKAKVVITNPFWVYPTDDAIRRFANDNNYPLVLIDDLGQDDSMMAKGEYWHEGVQVHPGDRGMQNIADRIVACMKENNYI